MMFALSFDLWGRVNVHAVTSQIQVWPPLYHISQQFHVLLFMLYYFNQLYFCSFQYWIASAVWWTEVQGYATCLYTHTFAHSVNCRLEHGMPGDICPWIRYTWSYGDSIHPCPFLQWQDDLIFMNLFFTEREWFDHHPSFFEDIKWGMGCLRHTVPAVYLMFNRHPFSSCGDASKSR